MCQVNSSASVGQADFGPLFQVVLVDRSGKYHSNIGHRFHRPGAEAACNGWNSQLDRELTAVIVSADKDPKSVELYGVVVTHASGKVALLNSVYKSVDAAHVVADQWQTETTRAVVAPLVRFDDFEITLIPFASQPEHFEIELQEAEDRDAAEMAEQAANAALGATDEDSDSDIESEDESGTSDEIDGSTFDDDDLDLKPLLFSMVDSAQMMAEEGDVSYMATLGLRYTLMRYLQSIIGAVWDNKIRHATDIGMISAGLERFVCQMIEGKGGDGLFDSESDDFNQGRIGAVSNPYGTVEALTQWLDAVGDPTAAKAVA